MKKLILHSALALVLTGAIFAQPSGGPPGEDPCKTERQTYCKDSRPGPETDRCLRDYISKLSETCKNHVNEMISRFEKFRSACAADDEKYCKNVERGPAHMKCMRENESKLSPACKAALPSPPPGGGPRM
ncbi:hypothetical protein [Leptospira neocaledonica]|uniref:Cys-rich protein n=1 Tax=Leptospira neocaledonica TaxID=2023192 RepID=A0A2M9ZZ44_9LEPT|nr:hypothetical protein [Leptospira neocaledonica]PJZ77298.1 hypothetical protein CH365_11215 [Leptospira neocaledonica]